MTLEEYFIKSEPQKVDDSTIQSKDDNVQIYSVYRTINFTIDNARYAKIFIAHPAPDIWALGFELRDGLAKPVIKRDCTSAAVTKGHIDKLVFGMTKVLERQLTMWSSKAIRELIKNAERQAYPYYTSRNAKPIKITI